MPDTYTSNLTTAKKDPYLSKVSSNARYAPSVKTEDERIYTPDMPDGVSIGSLFRQLDINAVGPSAQQGQYMQDMSDYLTGMYINKSAEVETLSPDDKIFASMLMSSMTGRETTEILGDFDRYSEAFTGIKTNKNFLQNWGEYFSGHWDRKEITNATMLLTEIPYDSPRRQYYEKYRDDLQEAYAKKTANVSTKSGVLRNIAQSGDIMGQTADQLMRAIELGLIGSATVALMASGVGAPAGVALGTTTGLAAIQAAQTAKKAYAVGSTLSSIQYTVNEMAKAEGAEIADRLMSMVDEHGNRIPLDIVKRYAYAGGLLSAITELSDNAITPIGSLKFGTKTVGEFFRHTKQMVEKSAVGYLGLFAGNTALQIGQEGLQGWIREKFIDDAVKSANESGATSFTDYQPKSASSDTSWDVFMKEAVEALPSLVITGAVGAVGGGAGAYAYAGASYVTKSLERKMQLSPQMKSDAAKYFNENGKVYDIGYIDTVGEDGVDHYEPKKGEDGKTPERKKAAPIFLYVNKNTGALVPVYRRDRQYVEYLRENGVTGVKGIIVSEEALNAVGNVTSAYRLSSVLAMRLGEDAPVMGYDGETIIMETQDGVEAAIGDIQNYKNAFSENEDTVEVMKQEDGSYRIVWENARGGNQSINIRAKNETDQMFTEATEETEATGNVRPVRKFEGNAMKDMFNSSIRKSKEETLQDEEVEMAAKFFYKQLTGLEEDEFNRLWKEDYQSIIDKLPEGVDETVIEEGARFMPLLSAVTGRSIEDLLGDTEHPIVLNYTGEAKKVIVDGVERSVRGEFGTQTNKKTKKREFVINLSNKADQDGADTLVHELMHLARRMASKERLEGFKKAYGQDDLWYDDIKEVDGKYVFNGKQYDTRRQAEIDGAAYWEERFVQDFFTYLKTGQAPNAEVATFFGQLKQFLQSFLNTYNAKLSDDTKRAFEKLLNGEVDVQPDQTVEQAVEDSEHTLTDEQETPLNSLSSEAQRQYDEVVAKYKGTDQWLKAPNGKPTNLTERQWVMVRTPNFIRWFGDWLNDPEHASKVLDENGEPLVVNHISIPIIDNEAGNLISTNSDVFSRDAYENGFWFSDNVNLPKDLINGFAPFSEDYVTYGFLNIREPLIVDAGNQRWNWMEVGEQTDEYEEGYHNIYSTEGLANYAEDNGYDGLIIKNVKEGSTDYTVTDYAAFASNQIKSATDNNGEFSNENDSILYSLADDRQWQVMDANTQRRIDADYEYVRNQYINTDKWMKAPNGQPTNLTERQWVIVRTPAFKAWFGDWENDPENASKVLDENGEPKVVYHGATASFTVFSRTSDMGYHFGTEAQAIEAQTFHYNNDAPWFGTADVEEDEFPMMELFLNLRNPVTGIEDPGTWTAGNWQLVEDLKDKGFIDDYQYKRLERMYEHDDLFNRNGDSSRMTEYLKNALVENGYDGIIYKNMFEAVGGDFHNPTYDDSYMVFRPNQAKSATDNIGEFDPENDSILYSLAEIADTEADHGLYVNNSTAEHFADLILDGVKIIETRTRRSLQNFLRSGVKVGDRIGIVSNGQLLGYVTLSEIKEYKTEQEFRDDYAKHLVKPNTKFDYDEKMGKVGLVFTNPKRISPVRVNRDSGYTTTTLYSLQNNDLPLDFYRNGGTIRYGNEGRIGQENQEGAADSAGLRGYIEYGISDGGDNGRLVDWRASDDEVEPEAHRSAQRPYLERGDIAGGLDRSGRGAAGRSQLLRRLNTVKGKSYTGVYFYELNKTPETLNKFIKSLNHTRENEKTGVFVSAKSLEELQKDSVRVFMSGDGNTGYAIEYDYKGKTGLNNLVAVFNNSMNGPKTAGAVYSILADAIEHGANILDCFADPKLLRSYSQMGFVPTGTVKFSEQALEKEDVPLFKKNKLKGFPVVAMYYVDRNINDTMDKLSDRKDSEWNTGATIHKYESDGYFLALGERDVIARDHLFGNRPEYRTNPENYRLGTRIGGAIGSNPSPLSEATGHGLQNWEDIPGREAVAEKIAGNLMGGAYKKQKDGTELRLPSPIPIRRQEGEKAIPYLRRVSRYGAENIKTIFRALHENVIAMEKKWYDNAHAFAVSMMNRYNLSIGQAAGIIATLSPNYEWDKNMALADIVADVMTNARNSKPSERMISYIREKYTDWTDERVNGFASKTLSQMSDEDAKNFIIVAIQAGEIDKTYMPTFVAGIGLHPAKGKKFGLSVGKDADVLKAVSMYRDGSLSNISDKLSKEAKVRSFYNNILVPGSDRGEMTADTWALRDFFLGMNPKYSDEMRNILFQGQGGAGTGLTAVINEGFRIAADEISAESGEDFLPQQIQSVVWTGIKAAWDNATKAGKRDALNAAWESGDVDTIRAIFTELINKYQPEAEVADEVEGLTLSRRAEDSTIFDEGSSSTQYNNLRRMTEESYMTTRQAAEAYQQSGGRESLNESVLFSLSPAKQAEVLQARKDEIQKAVEAGVYVSTDYLNEFRGEPWADLELELRDWMAENPEVVSLAREADSLEKFKEEYNKRYNKPADGEEQQGDADNDAWLETIYRYSNASSLEDRDRQFVAEWTASEDKTLELAKTLREYMNGAVSPRAKTRAGYMATRSLYNSFRGVDQKVRELQDGSRKNTKRATSEQIQEAQRLIQENPRAYRNAYMLATANGDVSNLELIDDDIAREMFNLEQDQEEARTLKTDYRANIKDLRQKINDAERDIRKAGEDPEKLDAEATKEKLETAKKRASELKAMIRSAENEVDRMIERMGNEVEKVNDKLEERRARVRELRSQLTDANVEVRRLNNALDALRRWKEAKLASDYRVKRIRQIKRLSEFNPGSIDAAYAQALFWVNSLFDMTDEVRQERRSLMDQIAAVKAQIDAAKEDEDTSALKQKLLYLRNMKKQSDWLAPPAQLAQYLPDLFVRADNRPSSWTAQELDDLLMALKQMRHDGKMMLEQKQTARLNRLLSIGYQYFMDRVGRMAQLGQSEDRFGNVFDYMSSRALEEDINTSIKEAKDPNAFKAFFLSYAKLQRLARLLDGNREGVLYDWFVRENWKHQGEELTQIRRRMEAAQAEWKRLGLKASDLAKEGFKGTKQNGTEYSLTRGQMIGVYVYSLNEIGKEKLTHYNGNNIQEGDIGKIVSQLTPEEKAWGDYMLQDFEENWQRLADVYYRGWNMILGKRDNYFTFVPSSAASEAQLENGMDPQGDIVGKDGKVYTEKGFTKEINPNAVYPLELDVTRSWNWQVRKQEHFMAYGEWAKDTQYLFDQSQILNLAERTIGKAQAENFKKIVNFVIGGETSNNDFDKAYTRWLAKRNSAVLIGNVGTILKQGPSWFAAFNGDVNPADVLKNAVAANATLRAFLAEHPEIADMTDDDVDTATRFIWANAPEMKNRQIDMDIAEQLSRMDGNRFANLFNPANRVIAKWTMGLVDKLVVNNLWMAKYYTEFEAQKEKGKTDAQAHREAVFKASQLISETQPTSMRMDQSAKQIDAKSSSFLRGIMVFTNQIINTHNQLFIDVPMAIRNKNRKKWISTIASTAVMLVTVGLLSGRFWRRPDEDDKEYIWRLARELAATAAQVAAPGFGSIVASGIEYDSAYSSYIFGLDTIGKSIKKLATPSETKSGWEKLGDVMIDLATEAGYAVGAPVTPLKNIVKSVEKGSAGYMLGGTWGQIIESLR